MQGCDGSILLDDNATFTREKMVAPNNNSLRIFEVIDVVKETLENECNQIVSCAYILALTAQATVFHFNSISSAHAKCSWIVDF